MNEKEIRKIAREECGPKVRIYVKISKKHPGAFSANLGLFSILIFYGKLTEMDSEEIRGIAAHENIHLIKKDALIAYGLLVLLVAAGFALLESLEIYGILLISVGLIIFLLVPLYMEARADCLATKKVGVNTMEKALKKLESLGTKSYFWPHGNLRKRLKRIERCGNK